MAHQHEYQHSVDQTTNDDNVYRFLITTSDHRKTFHLEVETQYEMQEWIRVIRLVSDLGVTKQISQSSAIISKFPFA